MNWIKRLNPFSKYRTEITRLTTLNQDMNGQIRELVTRRALTDQQWAQYERDVAQAREMAVEQGYVIEYLRTIYPQDFTGRLWGTSSFSQIVITYLKTIPTKD